MDATRSKIIAIALTMGFGFSGLASASESVFEVHGMLQAFIVAIDDGSGNEEMGLINKRTEVAIVSATDSKVSWVIMYDLAGGPNELRDSFVTVKTSDSLAVRVGQFAVPSALEGMQGAGGLWFPERASFTGGDLGDYRDRGVALMGKGGKLNYTVGLFNGEGHNEGPGESIARFAARGELSVSSDLTLGAWIDTVSDKAMDGMGEVSRMGFDLQWSKDKIAIQAEFGSESEPADKTGFYVMAKYQMSETMSVAARIDTYTNDDADSDETGIDVGLTTFCNDDKSLRAQLAVHVGSVDTAGDSVDKNSLIANLQYNF